MFKKNKMISFKANNSNKSSKYRNCFFHFLAIALLGFNLVYAQTQNNSFLYVKDGSYVYVTAGTFKFGSGSATNTTRSEVNYGKLIFDPASSFNGASSGSTQYTNGFASTKSNTYFILPIGQNLTYAPVGILNTNVINGVDAAYYAGQLTNSSNISNSISALPSTGYWDIKGDNSIITMIWNNDLSAFTNSITNLTVAGYNISTNKWEAIPSGTPSGSLINGTLTTSSIVTLNNYKYFTLAKRGITCADLVVSSGSTSTWNGSQWNIVPTLADAAIVSGNYPNTAGSFVCNSLVVNANITIKDGQTIEVVNGITGNGSITMSSESSILQRNDSSVIEPVIYLTKSTRTGMRANDYVYWGSPLKINSFNQLAGATAFNNANTIATGVLGAFDLKYKYISGNSSSSGGWQVLTATTPGAGFIMRMKLQTPFSSILNQNTTDHINLTFTGLTSNGTVTIPIANIISNPSSTRNYNLLANPYPSAIDADKFLEFNTNLDGVVYIWKAQTANSGTTSYSTSDYIAYTRAGSTADSGIGTTVFNGKISSGQGFKIKAITTNGTGIATFNNCMRISGNNNQFMKSSSEATIDRYKLSLTGTNGVGNQILIAYLPETTMAYDRMYDAELNTVSSAQIYSILDGSTTQLAINSRSPFLNTDIVNLGISKSNTVSENFTIKIADKEGVFTSNTVNIYLFDSLLGIYHNLANGDYSFNTDTTELMNRFQVVYQNNSLNSNEVESNTVIATINNEALKIVSKLPIKNIYVYDISGRLIKSYDVSNEININKPFYFSEGVYLAKIKLNTGLIISKKIIHLKK